MSQTPQGPQWWQASDGRWYPPESHPDARPPAATGEAGAPPSAPPVTQVPPADGPPPAPVPAPAPATPVDPSAAPPAPASEVRVSPSPSDDVTAPAHRGLIIVGALVALVVVAGVIAFFVTKSNGPSPTTGTTGTGGSGLPSASTVYHEAFSAALAAGTVHATGETVGHATQEQLHQGVVQDSTPTGGQQSFTLNGAPFHVLLIGSDLYVNGSAAVLENVLDVPSAAATQHAGQWISVPSTDSRYAALASGLTMSSFMAANSFTPQRIGEGALGTWVITGMGTPPGSSTGSADYSLVVQGSGKHLPVAETVHGVGVGQSLTGTIQFTKWGVPVTLTPPPNSVPLSTVTAG